MLCGDVTYFLCNGSKPSYKHIKIWGVIFYIINGCVTRNNLDYVYHSGYFIGYPATNRVKLFWIPGQTFVTHRSHRVWFDEYKYRFYIEDKQNPGSLLIKKILKVLFITQTSSTWFRVKLIRHPLHFVIQQFSHMKFSYLLLEIKLVLIYWIMNILQSLMSLIQSKICQPFINFKHRLWKCMDRCYPCRRSYHISSRYWWT